MKCPQCLAGTRQRELPLVIHIEPLQLVALNKACRYCPHCDLLIAHQDQLEALSGRVLLSTGQRSLGMTISYSVLKIEPTGCAAFTLR
jgi:hypothetical protein